MTTLTTVLAMLKMVFSNDMASQLMSGMAIVIICGLSYATLMTLYIVPMLYDILFNRKPPLNVDVAAMTIWTTCPDAPSLRHGQSSSRHKVPPAAPAVKEVSVWSNLVSCLLGYGVLGCRLFVPSGRSFNAYFAPREVAALQMPFAVTPWHAKRESTSAVMLS